MKNILSNKAYDILKWLALIFLNAFGILYQKLAIIWELPYGDQVFNTCVAISVFIGAIIGISTIQYNHNKLLDSEASYALMLNEANELREELHPTDILEEAEEEE